MRRLRAVLVGLLLSVRPAAGEPDPDVAYFVLALSWSPTFCRANPDRRGEQCGAETPFAFIVHGLWPQFEDGRRSFCGGERSGWVPRRLAESMGDLMPGAGLVGHQWRKHGTCTGLSQEDYFALVREAAGRVAIPPFLRNTDESRTVSAADLEDAFSDANRTLDENEMAVVCRKGNLEEIRICIGGDFQFLACPEIDRRGCRSTSVLVPAEQ